MHKSLFKLRLRVLLSFHSATSLVDRCPDSPGCAGLSALCRGHSGKKPKVASQGCLSNPPACDLEPQAQASPAGAAGSLGMGVDIQKGGELLGSAALAHLLLEPLLC